LLWLHPKDGAKESSRSGSPKNPKPKKLWLRLQPKDKLKQALALAPTKMENQKSSGSGSPKKTKSKKIGSGSSKKSRLGHLWSNIPEILRELVDGPFRYLGITLSVYCRTQSRN